MIEVVIFYIGDVFDFSKIKYNLEYYVNLVIELVKVGIYIFSIKVSSYMNV